jgi:hypothetical protein
MSGADHNTKAELGFATDNVLRARLVRVPLRLMERMLDQAGDEPASS